MSGIRKISNTQPEKTDLATIFSLGAYLAYGAVKLHHLAVLLHVLLVMGGMAKFSENEHQTHDKAFEPAS